MPELPEVEVVRRGLANHLTGATLHNVEITHPRTGRRYPGGSIALAAALEGATVTTIDRRGKFYGVFYKRYRIHHRRFSYI